jgi:prepilin-type N-terminal cleavage/methylation domain-containing protein
MRLTHTPIRAAFTLIELLVVIAIIGLLSTVAVVSLGSARVSARNATRRASMIQITKALELFYSTNSAYPSTVGVTGCPSFGGVYYCGSCGFYGGLPNTDSPTSWIPGLTSGGFIAQLPGDPNSGKVNLGSPFSTCRIDPAHNCYLYASDGTNYALFAYCTPEGTWASTDLFYSPGAASNFEWKLTNNSTATAGWF